MNVREEFTAYKKACYGDGPLPGNQEKEVEQAFLSGMHALIGSGSTDWGGITKQLKKRLLELGSFPSDGN